MITDYSHIFNSNFKISKSNSILINAKSIPIYDKFIIANNSTNLGIQSNKILEQFNQIHNISKYYIQAIEPVKLDSTDTISAKGNLSTDEFAMINIKGMIITNLSITLKQKSIYYNCYSGVNKWNQTLSDDLFFIQDKYSHFNKATSNDSNDRSPYAITQNYLTNIKNLSDEYYTIYLAKYSIHYNWGTYLYTMIKLVTIKSDDTITNIATLSNSNHYSSSHYASNGNNSKVVYEYTDSNGNLMHYLINIKNIDNNINDDDKPSNQFVQLGKINVAPDFNYNVVDVLDADSKNGNNKFNTDVRDSNWDTSVQGGFILPAISELIQYDDSNQFGIMQLSYQSANYDTDHKLIQYFKKYTIDADNDALAVSDITVDWNGFDSTYAGILAKGTIFDNHSITNFINNDTHYLIETNQFEHGNSIKIVFRFFKIVDKDTIKLLDAKTITHTGYNSNEHVYLHQTTDHIFHILHQDFNPQRIIFNFIDEKIEDKSFNYYNDQENIDPNSTKNVGPITYTKYYGLAYPNLITSDKYNSNYPYPLDYNIYNKTELNLKFSQHEYHLVANSDNVVTINVQVRDLATLQLTGSTVKLVTNVGVFHDNQKDTITVDVPESGLDVQIDIDKLLAENINVVGEILV